MNEIIDAIEAPQRAGNDEEPRASSITLARGRGDPRGLRGSGNAAERGGCSRDGRVRLVDVRTAPEVSTLDAPRRLQADGMFDPRRSSGPARTEGVGKGRDALRLCRRGCGHTTQHCRAGGGLSKLFKSWKVRGSAQSSHHAAYRRMGSRGWPWIQD